MRKNYLSFLISIAVCFAVLCFYNLFKAEDDGKALAAVDGHHYSSSERAFLRRNLGYDADTLLTMTGQDVRAALREPSLIRADSPTIIWQYRTDACVLDIYFNTSQPDAGVASVKHYEARTREDVVSKSVQDNSCVRDIMSQNGGWRMVGVNAFYKSPD